MAITVSGSIITFDDTSVAQSQFYDQTFGPVVVSEGGGVTISGRTSFNPSATAGSGKIETPVGVKTDASAIFTTPQSGTITVNPIISGVYVFAIGGGGGSGGVAPTGSTNGANGQSTFFSTVVGGGGTGSPANTNPYPSPSLGGAGGIATGGTTNINGSSGGNYPQAPGAGPGGNAGGYATYPLSGGGGVGYSDAAIGENGKDYGGGAGGSYDGVLTTNGTGGGGGGALALHPRLTITGGSPYPYRVGAGGTGGTSPPGGYNGAKGGNGYLKIIFYD